MRKLKLTLFTLLALFVFLSCSQNDNPAVVRQATTEKLLKKRHRIKIAYIHRGSLSSDEIEEDQIVEGIKFACEELNASGGVLGATIELIPFNDGQNLNLAKKTAYQICSDPEICAVIGHRTSAPSIANSLVYHYYGLLMFSPSATAVSLTQQGLPYVFRNFPDDNSYAKRAAQFFKKHGWNRVMLYYLDNTYGTGLASLFELNCSEMNITIPDSENYTSLDGYHEYSELAQRWKSNYNFDAIFLAGIMMQSAEIVSIFRENGITQPIVDGGEFDDADFFEIGNNKTEENVYTVSNYDTESTNPSFVALRKKFNERFGHDINIDVRQGYDALKVLAKAIEMAGSVRPENVANALRQVKMWDEGAGPYTFDASGNIANYTLFIKKTTDGVFKTIE